MAGAGNRGYGLPEHRGAEPGRVGQQRPASQQGGRQSESAASGTAGALKDKAQDAAASVAARAGDVWEGAQHMASSVASQAGEVWDETREGVRKAADTAEEAFQNLRGFMGRYPIATLCVGIGVGIAVGRLLEGLGSSNSSWPSNFRNYPSNVGP